MRTPVLFLSAILLAACGQSQDASEPTASVHPALYVPNDATETAPDEFQVRFETTKGDFVVKVVREWAPNGADRLYNLVRIGYYTDSAIYRVLTRFVAQFGVHGDPEISAVWTNAQIEADPVRVSNKRGFVTFAMVTKIGPSSRTTQLFVNLKDNSSLDKQGFAPIGEVVEGMEVVTKFYDGYADDVDRRLFRSIGNGYIEREFPEMDFIRKATIVTP